MFLAKVLTEGGHVGKVYELTGPEALDVHQVAKALSDATGKTITCVDVPEKAAAEGMKGAGMPDWAITGMGELYAVWEAGKGRQRAQHHGDVAGAQGWHVCAVGQGQRQPLQVRLSDTRRRATR